MSVADKTESLQTCRVQKESGSRGKNERDIGPCRSNKEKGMCPFRKYIARYEQKSISPCRNKMESNEQKGIGPCRNNIESNKQKAICPCCNKIDSNEQKDIGPCRNNIEGNEHKDIGRCRNNIEGNEQKGIASCRNNIKRNKELVIGPCRYNIESNKEKDIKLCQNKDIEACQSCNIREDTCDASQDDMNTIGYGNLYTIGKIWIHVLRSALVGANSVIPTVHAAPVKKDPERPKPMRASELPIYDCPHVAYRNFVEDRPRCDGMLHNAILPHVKEVRQSCQSTLTNGVQELKNTYKELGTDFSTASNKIKKYFRDDNNLLARKGLVVSGGLLGYHFGSSGGIPRKVFCTAFGASMAGILCFPNETDAAIRTVCYHQGKLLAAVFNYMSGRNLEIRERIPCPKPKPPDVKYDIKCSCK